MADLVLVRPSSSHVAALDRGWSPDTRRDAAAVQGQCAFFHTLDDPEALGPPVTWPDGSAVPRLPGVVRWMWDGTLCGSIGCRWQPGTAELPLHAPGHIGFGVVPWKRRPGYASRALALTLPETTTAACTSWN